VRVPESKIMTMREAVARFIPDGPSVCLNTGIEALIPFAARHELIRQRRWNLTLIGPSPTCSSTSSSVPGASAASSPRGSAT